jgi:hypothetical protein
VRLEAKSPVAGNELISAGADAREVGQQSKGALQASLVGLRW